MRSCTIACHLELREHSNERAIIELKQEIAKLKLAHAEEVQALKAKLKKTKDKYSAGEKE